MMEYCAVCGKPAECTHHLIGGTANRKLSDVDDICIKLCNDHHNMACRGINQLHTNSVNEKLSKMLGQALWELKYLATEREQEKARAEFVQRYGRNYL